MNRAGLISVVLALGLLVSGLLGPPLRAVADDDDDDGVRARIQGLRCYDTDEGRTHWRILGRFDGPVADTLNYGMAILGRVRDSDAVVPLVTQEWSRRLPL